MELIMQSATAFTKRKEDDATIMRQKQEVSHSSIRASFIHEDLLKQKLDSAESSRESESGSCRKCKCEKHLWDSEAERVASSTILAATGRTANFEY
jgi:hypothetical protein